jgi:O-antigen/teichoic acid export membrane protein
MNGKFSSVGRRLLSGSVLQMGNLVATAITAFCLMPFVVHHLGDRIYGFWALALSFIGYYSLLDFGLSSAVSQYMSLAIGRNDDAECRGVFNTALRINLLLGGIALLVTAAIVAVTPWFSHNPADAHLFQSVITILGVNAAIGLPVRVYGGVLYTKFRFDIQSWLTILGLVLRTALIVWVILLGFGLLALAWVTLLSSLPTNILQIWFARREASWARIERKAADLTIAKSLSSYSVYTFLAYIADTIRFQIDPLVISGLIGLAMVTHYRVAGVFAQYYMQMIIFSVGMLQPVFSRLHGAGDRSGIEKVFFFGTKLSSCISIFICLALIGWGKPFIIRWMGPAYQDAYWPLVVLSLAVLLDVCQKPSIDLLYATFNHRFYTYTNWAEGILNLVFSLLLAKPMGILGVAMGTLIGAFLIRVVVQPWWVCRVNGIGYPIYMRFLGRNLLYCTFLMAAATAISAWGLRPSYPLLVASATCATLIYAIGSWLVVFNPVEREYFKAAMRKNYDQKNIEPATATVAVP